MKVILVAVILLAVAQRSFSGEALDLLLSIYYVYIIILSSSSYVHQWLGICQCIVATGEAVPHVYITPPREIFVKRGTEKFPASPV